MYVLGVGNGIHDATSSVHVLGVGNGIHDATSSVYVLGVGNGIHDALHTVLTCTSMSMFKIPYVKAGIICGD